MWAFLSPREAHALLSAQTAYQCRAILRTKLLGGEGSAQLSVQDECRLDLFYHATIFAREERMQADQISVLHTLLHKALEACASTPFDNLADTFAEFRSALLCHSVQRPPFSEGVFPMKMSQAVQAYALNTIFRHFKLYKYTFTLRPRLDLVLPAGAEGCLPVAGVKVEETVAASAVEGAAEPSRNEDPTLKSDLSCHPERGMGGPPQVHAGDEQEGGSISQLTLDTPEPTPSSPQTLAESRFRVGLAWAA